MGGVDMSLHLNIATPAARAGDPASSHHAADEITRSGKRAHQAHQALDLVRAHPQHTSLELAQHGVLDRYQLARRLPELEAAGMIERSREPRTCTVGHRPAHTWTAKGTLV